ncbi:hypothetical protein LZ31DRAFT_554047 [Colletotrichum somersetense]|nr:hypothetical protein LZ31DRAFT_554047 [Colletotrichum somersetense]
MSSHQMMQGAMNRSLSRYSSCFFMHHGCYSFMRIWLCSPSAVRSHIESVVTDVGLLFWFGFSSVLSSCLQALAYS